MKKSSEWAKTYYHKNRDRILKKRNDDPIAKERARLYAEKRKNDVNHQKYLKRKEQQRLYRIKNRSRMMAYTKEYVLKNKDTIKIAHRNSYLKRKFLITLDDYNNMFTSQGGVCAICRETCKTCKTLAVDHCHRTGTIRGLLCQGCNTSISRFNDDIELLLSAIEYLKKEPYRVLKSRNHE